MKATKQLARAVALGLLLLTGTGCEKMLVGPQVTNTPEENFDLLWREFDQLYGSFEVRGVDWNGLYAQYRPQVTPATSEAELLGIVGHLLDHLNDGHVWIATPGDPPRRYDSGKHYAKTDFDLSVVKSRYLKNAQQIGNDVTYGTLANGRLGYVHLLSLGASPKFYEEAMGKALDALKDTEGLIVDARELTGGDDRSSQLVASRFASARKLFMTSRWRNGPGHQDFTPRVEWYVQPGGAWQYRKPVVLLTNRFTQSAGETFTLAMRQNPNVTQLGDSTYGIFSEATRRELPNGWIVSLSVGDYRAADGQSYEGIGLAPQVLVKNRKQDVLAGRDEALEKAMQRL
ncbi:S41 family peptidase [Hymenobacter cellulosivorans]|uniref:S41 family peptidase n=1 Tax=Hymenobacter cellulosivorans TaxID=2932249 RepID=A0ABY4F744_9BACT|nr:S41 family peptidase [Hymenobacter cellulosivorans]UOQ52036.1 S41 family peptidase [Hymenobacter cellulosivorans]